MVQTVLEVSIFGPSAVLRITQTFLYLQGSLSHAGEWGNAQSSAANVPLPYSMGAVAVAWPMWTL